MFNLARYAITGEWTESTGGMTTFAMKDGEKYFLKEYRAPIYPNHEQVKTGVMTEAKFKRQKERFEKFLTLRSTVNERLNEIASKGGNIICPLEWGVANNKFVEATEFVKDLITDERFIMRLSDVEKIMILVTSMAALVSVHKKKIIHGDIKFKNIAVAEKEAAVKGKFVKNYVGKLIDFDCSFLEDHKPSSVGGDQVYMSPEFCRCWITEMDPKMIAAVDYKTDIFSMGVLFHQYMTGELPVKVSIPESLASIPEDKIYYCEYVLNGGEPKVSDRIRNKRLAALITSMLQLDPAKRPSSSDALRELKEIKAEMERKPDGGSHDVKGPAPSFTFEAPWDEHEIEYVTAELTKMKYVGCKRIEVAGRKAYEFYRAAGVMKRYTKDQLLMSGLAVKSGGTEPVKPKGTKTFETPWEEHCIEFVQAEVDRMKYVSCKRIEVAGKKAYEFYRETGMMKRYTKEQLLMSGLARKI